MASALGFTAYGITPLPTHHVRLRLQPKDSKAKVTFGNPHNTEFLRRALQALIRSEVPIRDVTLEPTNVAGLTPDSRGAISDMSCVDEQGRHFIVEMQVAYSPDFLQRLKFYAFHKLNTLVQRGVYDWGSLPPIYCVALLSRGILPGSNYHTLANLRTENGELLDRQLTFVLAELDKFHLPVADVHTDLEKLLFTMQNVENPFATLENRPDFWEKSWLKDALHELNTRNMSPEKYEQMSRSMARRADILRQEERWAAADQKVAAADQKVAAADQKVAAADQKVAALENTIETTVRNLLRQGRFTVEEIADICGLTPEQVRQLQPA